MIFNLSRIKTIIKYALSEFKCFSWCPQRYTFTHIVIEMNATHSCLKDALQIVLLSIFIIFQLYLLDFHTLFQIQEDHCIVYQFTRSIELYSGNLGVIYRKYILFFGVWSLSWISLTPTSFTIRAVNERWSSQWFLLFKLYYFEWHLSFDISLDRYCFIRQNSLSKGTLRSIFKRWMSIRIDRGRFQWAILALQRAWYLRTRILSQLLFREHLLDGYLWICVLEGALERDECSSAITKGGDEILGEFELDLLVGRDVSEKVEHIENIMIESLWSICSKHHNIKSIVYEELCWFIEHWSG